MSTVGQKKTILVEIWSLAFCNINESQKKNA